MNRKKVIAVSTGIFVVIMAVAFYFHFLKNTECDGIIEYVPSRDRAAVIGLFKANWYWLIAGDNFSVEFMLDQRAPDRNPVNLGRLRFKVLYVDNMLAGITVYYMKKKELGRIMFLVIDEKYRGKGYSYKMMHCAMTALGEMGAQRIILLTRVSNVKAQHVYRRLGFQEYKYDPQGFVHFEYFPH